MPASRGSRATLEPLLEPLTLANTDMLQLTEESALRRRLDLRNRNVLPPLLWAFAPFFFAGLITTLEGEVRGAWGVPAAGMLLCVGAPLLLRRLMPRAGVTPARPLPPISKVVRRRFGEILRLLLLTLYALLVAWSTATGNPEPFAFMFALLMLLFRLPLGELVGLHSLMVVIAGLGLWWAGHEEALGLLLAGAVMHGISVVVGGFLYRGFRRRFFADWRRSVASAREQERVRQELALAREVQLSMLPATTPSLDWLDSAGACLPATEVGGDYYDFFPTEDGLAVAVADVAGHGLGSGLVVASVRAGLALLMDTETPERALERLDRLVARTSRRMLVSLALVRFHPQRGEVAIATAGLPPVLISRAGGAVEEVGNPGPPLGTRLPPLSRVVRVPFAPGDRFVVYTDGVVEMANGEGEPYGVERLQDVLTRQPDGAPASELVTAILADLEWHRGQAPQQDDLTVVVLVAR